MLYPGTDEDDCRKARAFAAHWIAEPFRSFHEAGYQLSYDDLARIMIDSGALLGDLDDRWRGGTAVGDLFKAFYILAKNDPALASWENAIRIYEVSAQRARVFRRPYRTVPRDETLSIGCTSLGRLEHPRREVPRPT